jgi:hypothetical protein
MTSFDHQDRDITLRYDCGIYRFDHFSIFFSLLNREEEKRIRKKGVAIKLVKWSTREGNCRNGRVWLESQNGQIRTKMMRCCKNLVGRKRFFRSRRQSESGQGVRIQNDRKHALDGPFAKFMTALWRPKRRLLTSGDPAYLGTVGEGGEIYERCNENSI